MAPWARGRGASWPPPLLSPRVVKEPLRGRGQIGEGGVGIIFLAFLGAVAVMFQVPRAMLAAAYLGRGTPAPEQAPLGEEGRPLTCQKTASTGPGVGPESTATTSLASRKEQITLHAEENWSYLVALIEY